MIEFEIPNMSCGHCVRSIDEALKAADPAAKVMIDLPTKHVQVDSQTPRETLAERLREAGYAPA